MTLTELFTNIANAIREKKGTTESIVAENFPEEIANIESGGKTKLQDGTRFYMSTFSSFNLNDFDYSELTTMSTFLSGCTNLTSLDFSNMDLSNITNYEYLCNGCSAITTINLSDTKLGSGSMQSAFAGCSSLTSINLSNSYKIKPTSMNSMFSGDESLVTINLADFDTSSCTQISNIFKNCTLLENIDMSNFNLSKLNNSYTNYQNIVQGCTNLTNNSLNSILKAFTTASKITTSSYKRLSRLGLTQEQATICTTLSNWSDLQELGWTTGY